MKPRVHTHLCPGCGKVRVPNALLACRPCWMRLSQAARDAIHATAHLPLLHRDRRAAVLAARNEWRVARP